jgi:hypothetical protein
MKGRLTAFLQFLYDFVIGEDWRLAAGVVLGLGLTAAVAHETNVNAWWMLPVIVVAMLLVSVWRAARVSG